MPHHVAILAYDRLGTFEFGCAVELFALDRPELKSDLNLDWYSYAVCAAEPGLLRAMGQISIYAPYTLAELARADTIIMPGWRDVTETPPAPLLKALQAAWQRGARICSICSGVFVLAHAGVLDGKRATTHWRYAQRLAAQFPQIAVDASALYIDEGQVVTAAGSAAGLDMLLHLVRRDHGTVVANKVAQRLVMSAHREGGQAQFIPRPMPTSQPGRIAQLLDWLRANLRVDHSVEAMAVQANMSKRTLQRQFLQATGMAPNAWLVGERVALAKELLETHAQLDIEAVADLAGFGSPESLRRHFRLHGLPPPLRYRNQFTRNSAAGIIN